MYCSPIFFHEFLLYLHYFHQYKSFLSVSITFYWLYSEQELMLLCCVSAHNTTSQLYWFTALLQRYLQVVHWWLYVIKCIQKVLLFNCLCCLLLIWFAILAHGSGHAFAGSTMMGNFANYATIWKLTSSLKLFKICPKVNSSNVFLSLISFSCYWFLSVAIFLLNILNLKSFHCSRRESLDTFEKNFV